ncbi:MAG: polysaccharide biosynthesis/export protein [Blastocatellia bacterium]|jgi:protein involved in polysaccharide export with SLBB domain|nr:polysaccharide biosynthesis/export protein [Blastocatellia bacterium]
MKNAPYVICALFAMAFIVPTSQAQIDSRTSTAQKTTSSGPQTDFSIRTSRIVGSTKASNHAIGAPDVSRLATGSRPSVGSPTIPGDNSPKDETKDTITTRWGNASARVEEMGTAPLKIPATAVSPAPALSLTRIYRVGVGDVLDIRLKDVATRESTLFTVLAGGVVEYPLIEEPVKVEGMRVDEIAARLASRIKVIDQPRLLVNVRDHASHNVLVTGLVYNPGSKALRQEAVPLFVVLAEAVTRQGASRATITRNGQVIAVDLANQTAISTLVMSGDLVTVSNAPPAAPQYYIVSGEINSPGQKLFRSGLTLTQSLLASGGITQNASGRVKLTSQVSGAPSVTIEVNIKEILEGRNPDPTLKPGDRLEVTRGRW